MYRFLNYIMPVFLFLAACSGEEEHRKEWGDNSKLMVGTDATYPPFEMINTKTGQPEGFDIDIIKAVSLINKWNPEFIISPFDGIVSGLKNRKYDCIISAMTITPQREAIIDFTEPYYLAGQVIAVPIEDTTVSKIEDLRGLRIGVQLGTTGAKMARSFQGVAVFSFDNIGAAFIDMENGHIDAVLNDWPTTRKYINLKGKAKIVGEILSEEHYGIAVKKGEVKLLKKINTALNILKESGEYRSIEKKWFDTPDSLP